MRNLAIGITVLVLLTSCVSKKKYDLLQNQFQEVYENQQRTTNDLVKCKSLKAGMEDQIESQKLHLEDLKTALEQCLYSQKSGQINVEKLLEQLDESNKYIKQLVDSKNRSDSLNMALSNKLTASLSREELRDIDVKVKKGVVFISLSDNMLYQSGSYKVNEQAEISLAKIAKIINDYPEYDVLVEGNTDNVPIAQTNIRNNWDLSALRASSVVQLLQDKYGINPQRMTAGGRGEYNNVVLNDTPINMARNRRTEIIIMPKLDQFLDLVENE